jgi:hypothetical protein
MQQLTTILRNNLRVQNWQEGPPFLKNAIPDALQKLRAISAANLQEIGIRLN